MIDRIDADNRIEPTIVEWESLACVCLREASPPLKSRLARASVSIRDGLVVELDPDDLASGQPDKVQARAAGPASHVQEPRQRAQVQPAAKPLDAVNPDP